MIVESRSGRVRGSGATKHDLAEGVKFLSVGAAPALARAR
jgi:hypothetical protein